MICARIVRRLGAAHAECRLHSGRMCGVELRGHIRDEHHLRRRLMQRVRDRAIACSLTLRPGGGVEIAAQETREIARGGVRKQIALRLDAARREDRDLPARPAPAFERRLYIGIEFALALELTAAIARFPD